MHFLKSVFAPVYLVSTQSNSMNCSGLLQMIVCINDIYICSLASLTLGIMGSYPSYHSWCAFVSIVRDDELFITLSVITLFFCTFSSFQLHFACWGCVVFSYLEQLFSSLVQTLWNQGRVDSRYFVHLCDWCEILSFCMSCWGQDKRIVMLSVCNPPTDFCR